MKLSFNVRSADAEPVKAKLLKVLPESDWTSHTNEKGTTVQYQVTSRYEGISAKASQMLFALERDKLIKVLEKPEVR